MFDLSKKKKKKKRKKKGKKKTRKGKWIFKASKGYIVRNIASSADYKQFTQSLILREENQK
jgi:hypothetical protein